MTVNTGREKQDIFWQDQIILNKLKPKGKKETGHSKPKLKF
jgi:hypothetical protein